MKQKIDRLARGIFDYSLPEIVLSDEKLRISTVSGSTYRGAFTIKNNKGTSMKGVLYSSSRMLTLSTAQFIGEENRIEYSFKADYADSGERITGTINIVSDCGETELPFEAVIRPPYIQSSIGEIRDLFQLANLAKTDWNEAERIFQSPEMQKALPFYDSELVEMYEHLDPATSPGQALEELLVAIRKKVPLTINADKNKLEYAAGVYSFLDKIVLTKNTWGYAEYKIDSDADFIRPRNTLINTKMFGGNSYELGLVVEPAKLHAGLNLATITIENATTSIKIPVTCRAKSGKSAKAVQNQRIKEHYSRLVTNYIRFRLNRQSQGRYINEAENLLTGLENLAGTDLDFIKLYRTHLLLSQGKEQQFNLMLNELEAGFKLHKDNPELKAGILYLSAMRKKNAESADNAVREIRALRARYPEKWILLWFLLQLDRALDEPGARVAAIAESFYQNDVRSPILYYEAAAAYNEAPEILSDIKLFELQVINFAVKNTMVAQGAAAKLAFAARSFGEYNYVLEKSLRRIYELYANNDCLESLCRLMLSGNRTNAVAHYYYEKGIIAGLTLTGLNEAYIKSAPKDVSAPLEHRALNYFAYNCNLDDERKAYLYANIVKNTADYGFIRQNYESSIREFTVEKMKEGAIDRNLAVLYDNVVPTLPMTSELAGIIPNVCFYYEITCESKDIVAVYVSHKEIQGEVLVPMNKGAAYIEMFTEKADVVLGDKEGKRYISTVDYHISKLVHLDNILERCANYNDSDYRLVLHLAEKARYEQRRDASSVELTKQVTRIPNLKPEYIRDCTKELIYYYYDNYEGDMLESYLLQIDLGKLDHSERIKIIEFMIVRDLYNVALKAMSEYGFEGIDVKRLMKLCSRLILNAGGMEKVDILVAACFYCFKEGRSDEIVLGYLNDYYYGTTAEMYEIWKAARTYELDTLELEERLLAQMLFAESYISNAKAVFTSYYRSGKNKSIIRAFLSYYAYKYLMNDRVVEPEIFEIMRNELHYDDNDVCLLAVLKYYSTCEQLTDAEVNFVDMNISRLEQKELILPFFKNFRGNMRIPQDICDKYYVEYRTDPNRKVVIHYSFEDGNGDNGYVEEEMRNVCYGIFVKEFVIFGNEALQYYITEDAGEGDVITESREIRPAPEQNIGEDTKYYQLNMIISAREMRDEKTALKLLDTYIRTDYDISKLFTPI